MEEKKKIRIAFCGLFYGWSPIYRPLIEKNFEMIEDSENPDFVLCSMFGKTLYEPLKYDCVRILISGEPYDPDFNLYDYALGHSHIEYDDRYCFNPIHLGDRRERLAEMLERPAFTHEDLKEKTVFCDFIYRHERDDDLRGEFFEELNKYKKVVSYGNLCRNTKTVIPIGEKDKYQSKSKFTIAFENSNHRGYFTEKIFDAFFARSIPIYLGDPDICDVYNSKAFINCSDYSSFDEVIERVKEIDQNDDLYVSMLNEPIFNPSYDPFKAYDDAEEFFKHIFSQSPEEAFRRHRAPVKYIYSPLKKQYDELAPLYRSNKEDKIDRMAAKLKVARGKYRRMKQGVKKVLRKSKA